MLDTFIYDKKGNAWLNTLRRFVLSGVVVPSSDHIIAKMPAASSASSPGISGVIPLQGPQDARSELFTLTGAQGLSNIGDGTLVSLGAAVTGTNTKFLTQLQAGDTIVSAGQTRTVLAVISNTSLTTTVAFAPALAGSVFAYSTPIVAAVRDRMTVEITDTAWQRNLMNRPVLVNHVFGSNRKPTFLRESTLLETNQTLLFRFFNNSTSGPGSFGFSSEARKWQAEAMKRRDVAKFIEEMRSRKRWVQPYWFTLDNGFTTLQASSSADAFLTCTGDITLVLFNIYGQALTTGNAGDTQEKVLIELQDVKTGRTMQNQPFTLNTGTGTSENPYVLPCPWIVEPQTQIRAKFTNLITNGTTDVFLTFHGVAFYTGNRAAGGGLIDPHMLDEARRIYQATRPDIIPASPQG